MNTTRGQLFGIRERWTHTHKHTQNHRQWNSRLWPCIYCWNVLVVEWLCEFSYECFTMRTKCSLFENQFYNMATEKKTDSQSIIIIIIIVGKMWWIGWSWSGSSHPIKLWIRIRYKAYFYGNRSQISAIWTRKCKTSIAWKYSSGDNDRGKIYTILISSEFYVVQFFNLPVGLVFFWWLTLPSVERVFKSIKYPTVQSLIFRYIDLWASKPFQ